MPIILAKFSWLAFNRFLISRIRSFMLNLRYNICYVSIIVFATSKINSNLKTPCEQSALSSMPWGLQIWLLSRRHYCKRSCAIGNRRFHWWLTKPYLFLLPEPALTRVICLGSKLNPTAANPTYPARLVFMMGLFFFLLCQTSPPITKAPDSLPVLLKKSADFDMSTEVTTPKLCWEHVIITTVLRVLTSSVQIAHR